MVVLFYLGATIFVGMALEKIVRIVFSAAHVNDTALFGEGWTISTVIGFGVAVVAAVVAWRSQRAQTVSLEVASELKKVTWPTLRETRAATIAVIAATFVAAVLLGFFDYVWAKLSDLVY